MCNGSSSRVTQGGSIAVLGPYSDPSSAPGIAASKQEWKLLFTNRSEGGCAIGTQVELKGMNSVPSGSWITIQYVREVSLRTICYIVTTDGPSRYGDLRTSYTDTPLKNHTEDYLCSFAFNANSTPVVRLSRRLDLAVGDSGIIGRKVSVRTGSSPRSRILAEGIIGWN
jgi:hypothetical protein